MALPTITCPRCKLTSHHPMDVEQLFCGWCRWWTSDPLLAGAMLDGVHQERCNLPQCSGCMVSRMFLPS